MAQNHSTIRWIAFIGNYLPRQRGMATFAPDLSAWAGIV
jgi:hypothetical protein